MMTQDEIRETEDALQASQERLRRHAIVNVFTGTSGLIGSTYVSSVAASTVASGMVRNGLTTAFALTLFAPVGGFIFGRSNRNTESLITNLRRKLRHALEEAHSEAAHRQAQVDRQEFETKLANALEMADSEPEVVQVIERALVNAVPESPAELLLADNSHSHLIRMVGVAPEGEPPDCAVDSPDRCPAARRAQVQRFSDSEDLDACPKLRDRGQGRCCAVCVPVSIMGRAVGVIHATGKVGTKIDDSAVADLEKLAKLAGTRIGFLRVMAETQLQAATDSLTGLMNRRSLENQIRALRDESKPFALVMADLDHFKALNDTYGHETGDHALRLFAQTLETSVRDQDLVCRYGGEEFVVVFPNCTSANACSALESLQVKLSAAILGSGIPAFTASFGVVEPGSSESLTRILNRADDALFEAKRNGRDQIVVHDAEGNRVEREPAPSPNGNGHHTAVPSRPPRTKPSPLGAID